MTDDEIKVLEVLFQHTRHSGEYCITFDYTMGDTNLSRKDVRNICRSLRGKGLAEFYSGLMTDDGEVAGSGYCISWEGYKLFESIENSDGVTITPSNSVSPAPLR